MKIDRKGPIAFMASNPIAANLLMVFFLFAGLFAAGDLVQEMLPDASLDLVQVVVPYPGAAPEEVEQAIVRKIEEEIGSVDGVQRIETSAAEGLGSLIVEFKTGTDIGRALNDVKARVDRIPSFPAGAERPEVREVTSRAKRHSASRARRRAGTGAQVLTRPDGTSLRLGDIADLRDGFADTELITRFNGNRAVRVDVSRTADEQVLEIAEAVRAYLASEVIPTLPAGVGVEIWRDDTTLVGSRLSLLFENGLLGLVLVFLGLTLFLEIRLAVWVAAGLVVSLVGTLWVMRILGISINMFSMLALVLALGIVVDDAIVVGENIFAERKKGRDGLTTAIRGTKRISGPVIFSVLTTITAFAALLAVPGPTGKMMRSIPIVVVVILCISLVESLTGV